MYKIRHKYASFGTITFNRREWGSGVQPPSPVAQRLRRTLGMDTLQTPLIFGNGSVGDDVLRHVVKTKTCWFWALAYGGQKRQRAYFKNQLVYRLLFEHYRGPIPDGLGLDHVVCNNPRCINPWHVEPRTQKQNLARVNILANFGTWAEKGNALSGANLGAYLGLTDRERNALGQFTGG